MLRFLVLLVLSFSLSVSAEYDRGKLEGYLAKMNRSIKAERSKNKKIQLLTEVRNRVQNTQTRAKKSKYDYLVGLKLAYNVLDPDAVSAGKCEILRADLQFRFAPRGFEKGKIKPYVMQALNTLKAFCPTLKIYQ